MFRIFMVYHGGNADHMCIKRINIFSFTLNQIHGFSFFALIKLNKHNYIECYTHPLVAE